MAVVKGLAVSPIEIMVLVARVQLSRSGGQGVGCRGWLWAAVGPIETMVLAARVQLSRPGGQGVGCS